MTNIIMGNQLLKALYEAELIRPTTKKVVITAEVDTVALIEETYMATEEWTDAINKTIQRIGKKTYRMVPIDEDEDEDSNS